MENFHWKTIFIVLVLIIFAVFFKEAVEFFTFVVTDFVETVVDIIKGGLTARNGIEPVVRFCLTVIIIFGLIRLLNRQR
jgi:hypothetical protein